MRQWLVGENKLRRQPFSNFHHLRKIQRVPKVLFYFFKLNICYCCRKNRCHIMRWNVKYHDVVIRCSTFVFHFAKIVMKFFADWGNKCDNASFKYYIWGGNVNSLPQISVWRGSIYCLIQQNYRICLILLKQDTIEFECFCFKLHDFLWRANMNFVAKWKEI